MQNKNSLVFFFQAEPAIRFWMNLCVFEGAASVRDDLSQLRALLLLSLHNVSYSTFLLSKSKIKGRCQSYRAPPRS